MTILEWVDQWKEARNDGNSDYEKVLRIWNKNPAKYCRTEEDWKNLELGYRRKSDKLSGEKPYEKKLLDKQEILLINPTNHEYMKLTIKHNAFPLANKKRGQTITDCMGVLYDKRGKKHPTAIEIKEKANNPWYAVVETLQQIRLMRASVRELEKYFKNKFLVDSIVGAWGMLLAPEEYYQKKKKSYEDACKLCDYMAKHSRARVIIASVSLDSNVLQYKAGYWPK